MRAAGRRGGTRALGTVLAAIALAFAGPPGASADIPVGDLVVLQPEPGTTVEPPVEVFLLAGDRAPAGLAVRLYVDGEPLDPDDGELGGVAAPPFTMAAGERRRVEVVDLDAGAHTLTVEVSGSGTEQPESVDVRFSVSGAGTGSSALYLGILLGVLAVAFVVTRRRMRQGRRDPWLRQPRPRAEGSRECPRGWAGPILGFVAPPTPRVFPISGARGTGPETRSVRNDR